jgi:hypothetical protein
MEWASNHQLRCRHKPAQQQCLARIVLGKTKDKNELLDSTGTHRRRALIDQVHCKDATEFQLEKRATGWDAPLDHARASETDGRTGSGERATLQGRTKKKVGISNERGTDWRGSARGGRGAPRAGRRQRRRGGRPQRTSPPRTATASLAPGPRRRPPGPGPSSRPPTPEPP